MRPLLIVLLLVYALIVFWLLFVNVGSTNRSEYFTQKEVRLIPFYNTVQSIKEGYRNDYGPNKTHLNYYRYLAFRNIAGNLLLFMPWGLIAPLLFVKLRSVRRVALFTAILSALAEITQYLLMIGVFDIDDIMLNTAGAAIGCFFTLRIKRQYFAKS